MVRSIAVLDGDAMNNASVERAGEPPPGVDVLFVGNAEDFGRMAPYVDPKTGVDYEDNDRRFAFFCRAALEVVRQLEWPPDVVHVHDWQAALIPAYLSLPEVRSPFFDGTRTVLTIHNLGYQGLFEAERFADLGLPEEMFYAATGALEFFDKVNFLKGGIMLADKITTVSEKYAEEIKASEEFGCGLEGVLADRGADVCGILNGADYSIWSPKTDKLIPHRYGLSNLSGKRMARVELLRKAGLPLREKHPVVGMVTRLASQKGLDLVVEAAKGIFALDLQMIILGTGDEEYHLRLSELEKQYPDKLKVYLEFNDALAHEIQAGVDIFLMPSRYEPCGLNQLYALKYGTVPLVRSVGGLADTVVDYDPESLEGTGFVFSEYDADAMLGTLTRAVALFQKRQAWIKLMKNGMRQDFSWDASADRYTSLYEALTNG
jgi:starch synthase